MSNFSFLEPEFKSLAATAKEAEKLTYISPQFAIAAARTSLENLVLVAVSIRQKTDSALRCITA